MTQLGASFADRGPARSRDELVVRGDLDSAVAAALAPEIRRLEMTLRALVPKEYPTPQVTVNPNVTVQSTSPAAQVGVEVELEGFDALAAEIKSLRKDLNTLVKTLGRPTVRTVERDSEGRITAITDRRA